MLRLILIVMSAFAISGCGGGNAETSQTVPAGPAAPEVPTVPTVPAVPPVSTITTNAQIAKLEADGKIPQLDRSATLLGTDSNKNGIRDDIDVFIAATYTTQTQRAAAQQFASLMQAAIDVNKSDLTEVKALSIKATRAVNCIYSKFDGTLGSKQPALVVEELRAVSTNTKARLLAYLSYSKALDGTSGALPEGDTCE